MADFRVASLFSGCGGMDLGARDSGGNCVYAADSDEACVKTFSANLDFEPRNRDLVEGLGFRGRVPKAEVVIAGPPCQGFSVLGSGRSDDTRNSLLPLAATLSLQFRPQFVVLENVLGVLNPHHRSSYSRALGVLRKAGYTVSTNILSAQDVGLPQLRRRVFIVGSKGSQVTLERPTSVPTTLGDILCSVDGLSDHDPIMLNSETVAGKLSKHLLEGEYVSNTRKGKGARHTWEFPSVFGATNAREREVLEALLRLRRQSRVRDFGDADPVTGRRLANFLGRSVAEDLKRLVAKGYIRKLGFAYDLTHAYNGKFRRPSLGGIVAAVDTRFGEPNYLLHPREARPFTVREAARLQGFPDSFTFHGSRRDKFRMIGNSVAPPLSRYVVSTLAGLLR